MKLLVITLILSIVSLSSFAERIEGTFRDSQFINEFWETSKAKILIDRKKDMHYSGVAGTQNYYAAFEFPENSGSKSLILVTGVEDPIPLWFDTVLAARVKGFSKVFVVEIRGQGQSQRVPGNSEKLIHVESFEDYYTDLVLALRSISKNYSNLGNSFIISHSTGSLVVANSLSTLKEKVPNLEITSMAFWSPLVILQVKPILKSNFILSVLKGLDNLYRKCCGIFTGKKYIENKFAGNRITSDSKKFKLWNGVRFKYGLGSSGVSLSWAIQAISATSLLRTETLPKLKIPTLLIKSGADLVVDNNFKLDNPKIKELTLDGARHALNIESPLIFSKLIDATFSFFFLSESKDKADKK